MSDQPETLVESGTPLCLCTHYDAQLPSGASSGIVDCAVEAHEPLKEPSVLMTPRSKKTGVRDRERTTRGAPRPCHDDGPASPKAGTTAGAMLLPLK